MLSEGYNTYGGSLDVLLSRYYGFNKGFQFYYDGIYSGVSRDEKIHRWLRKLKYLYILPFLRKTGLDIYLLTLKNLIEGKAPHDRAEEWINNITNMKLEEPYFLWLFFVDTHYSYVPPEQYAKWGNVGTRRMIYGSTIK